MPKFAANLSMLFTEEDFLDRFQAAASRKPPTSGTARKALLSSIEDAPGRRAARSDDDICGA